MKQTQHSLPSYLKPMNEDDIRTEIQRTYRLVASNNQQPMKEGQ